MNETAKRMVTAAAKAGVKVAVRALCEALLAELDGPAQPGPTQGARVGAAGKRKVVN